MKWFYNMKIGTKLISAFLIVACIAGVIGVIGVMNINTIDKLDTKLYETMTVPLGELIIIAESFQRTRGNVKDIILAGSEEEISDYETRIKQRDEEFRTNLESFKKTLLTEEGHQLVERIFSDKANFDALVARIIELVRAGNRDAALDIMHGEADVLRSRIETDYRRTMEIKIDAAKNTSDSNSATAAASIFMSIVILVGGMLLAVFLGIFIASSIKKPINKLVAASEKMAEGNLDTDIDISTKDELGALAASFKAMIEKNNEVLSSISSSAEQVSSGARQVSDSSIALSQGATEQATSVEELTASLEQISSQTKNNAENADEANKLAVSAKDNAQKGNEQMSAMLKSMEGINESSSSISKIIKVIDEIAFQTNILALNAAVEAARAGQHGKGFAVVAEEVRNLAARSANAASETTEMIEGCISKTVDGTKIAAETASALENIVSGVEKVADLVGDIARASNEQSLAIGQVSDGVMQISQVIQTNSATAEESSAASEELSEQAARLKEMVGRFKLKKRTGPLSVEAISPEILKALEDASKQKKNEEEPKEKIKIKLNDVQFGKY